MNIVHVALAIGGAVALKAAIRGAVRSRPSPRPSDEPDEPDDPIVEPPYWSDDPIAPPPPANKDLKLRDWAPPPKSTVPQMFAQAHLVGHALEDVAGRPCLEWEVYRTHTPFVVNGKQHDTVLMYRSCFDADWTPFVVAKGKTEEQLRDLEVKAALNDIRAETLSAYTKAVL